MTPKPIANATPRNAARRSAANRAFLTLCLAVTSLAVLALAVLLLSIFFQGTRSLFGFQITVLPPTDNTSAIIIDEDRQRITFTYPNPTPPDADNPIPPDVRHLHTPVDIDLASASITRDDGTAFLELPQRTPIRIGDTGSVFNRIAIIGSPDPTQTAEFITGDPSLTPSDAGFRAPILGSLWLLAVCAAAAIPLGVGTAIFLEEFSPRARPLRILHGIVQTNIRNLAGVPSVVYGLIGLTAFARMFGLFGSPGQFTDFERIITNDNQTIVGQVIEDRTQRTYTIRTQLFGNITFDADEAQAANAALERIPPGDTVPLTGTVDRNQDFEFVITTDQLGTLTLDAARASELDQSILFEDPFQTRTLQDATLAFVGAGELIVQTPANGIVTIDKARIDNPREDRDRYLVRKHTYTIAENATISRVTTKDETEPLTLEAPTTRTGRAVALDGNTVTLFTDRRGGEHITFDTDDIIAYTPTPRLQLGDEDTPLFLALPFGTSVIAGGLTLMLVILPVIIIASQESLRAVPNSHREGALALGATRLQMIARTTLPAATPGIMTGSILSMSRAIGEAAPILIIGGAGFVTFAPENFMSGFAAMPLQIYSWTSQADREFQLVAASGIIVLLTILFLFNATAIIIRGKLQKQPA